MKKTSLMAVSYSTTIPRGQIIMHPNEGSDLGLFTKTHKVEWCKGLNAEEYLKGSSGTVQSAQIELLNDCPHNTVQINIGEWQHEGMPDKAVLFLDGTRLFLHGAKNAAKK